MRESSFSIASSQSRKNDGHPDQWTRPPSMEGLGIVVEAQLWLDRSTIVCNCMQPSKATPKAQILRVAPLARQREIDGNGSGGDAPSVSEARHQASTETNAETFSLDSCTGAYIASLNH